MLKKKSSSEAVPPPQMLVPPSDPSLPPGPPQMNKPVGEPPPPRELPRTFAECEERSRQAASGDINKAQLWATLAQAHALKEIADKLDAFNEYIGVYDDADNEDLEDGEKPAELRFADAIAEGILGAVSVVKDDMLAAPLVQMAIEAAKRGAAEAAKEQ